MRDPYEVLGIQRGATDDEIKKAYRAKCKRWHPDLNPNDPTAEEHFKEVQAAYDAITKGETGPQGPTGATGKGVKSAAVTYQVATSGTTVPTGSWVAAVPAVSQGQFLWSRTIVTYTDSTTSTVYSVSYYAKDGARGETGATGETGSAGSTILTGATAPTSTQGKVGDIFIQTNGDWYVKE